MRYVNKSWLPGLYSQHESERLVREVLTNHGFQDYTRKTKTGDCTRDVNKSWSPGRCAQCKNAVIAREMITNHGFQDYTRNVNMKELYERC